MKYLSHYEIRKKWLDFFESKGHKIVESAPLVPLDDDSLLWINAGVTPLKKFFDGSKTPDCRRLTNIQKCIRTNDIENVGITKRHQTFFEMMGNFSIGDYFKKEAIEFSFELLTSPEWFDIPKELLYVTVYPTDKDAVLYWEEVGLDPTHIVKLEENYWEIGEGPCGPDSEIFFDRGEKYDPKGDALEKFKNDIDQERYVEIWNNVFSQFNSEEGKKREEYKELPSKNIDTGAGLERWCCIFQDVDSNFETDLFKPIIKKLESMSNILYDGQTEFKVIADHIRAIVFALNDGASFDNVGRGYILRRLLRRGVRYGKKLGFNEPFMYKLVDTVVDIMKPVYPELEDNKGTIKVMIMDEEKLFLKTLDTGLRRLNELVKNSSDGYISGEDAFKLYDTYGFPFELTSEYLEELGYRVSKEEFDKYMKAQRDMAKENSKTKTAMASQKKVLLEFTKPSEFVYGIYRMKSNVLAIVSKEKIEDSLNHDGYIILNRTCFYAESGGQVSDTGMITGKNFKARVLDVFKGPNGQHIHKVKLLDGVIKTGDSCDVIIDKERRKEIEANHSSVHLLQYALRSLISDSIHQAGSYVDNEKLRFDFTYPGHISDSKLIEVEKKVNELINKGIIVSTEILPIEKAKELGALALFDEKYSNIVRVVKMDKSIEFCGGTHVANTKDIKNFAIYSCESKGSNVLRIEAATGAKASTVLLEVIKPYNDEKVKLLMKAKTIIEEAKKIGINLSFDVDIDHDRPTGYESIVKERNELSYVQEEVRALEKEFFSKREAKTLNNLDGYKKKMKKVKDIEYLIEPFEKQDTKLLKSIADHLSRDGKKFIFLVNIKEDKSFNFICKSTCNINAGLLVKNVSIKTDGNGGGSDTFAQGGGRNSKVLKEALEYVKNVVEGYEE